MPALWSPFRNLNRYPRGLGFTTLLPVTEFVAMSRPLKCAEPITFLLSWSIGFQLIHAWVFIWYEIYKHKETILIWLDLTVYPLRKGFRFFFFFFFFFVSS